MWLPPGQTRNAVVMCYIPPNVDIGTKDKITFTSQGMNFASQAAMLTITSPVSAGTVRVRESIKLTTNTKVIDFFHFVCLFVGSNTAQNILELW